MQARKKKKSKTSVVHIMINVLCAHRVNCLALPKANLMNESFKKSKLQ